MRYFFFKSTKILSILFLFLSINSYTQTKKVYAVKTLTPPVLDGLLNDSVWNSAIPISDFLQQEPVAGNPATKKTTVRILYDEDNIYVSFMCYDNEPNKIVARALKLDGAWGADDNISLIFDTFNDKRSGYWFGTNPLGMRDDALINGDDISGFNEQWNGIWDVRSAIVDSGWSAELVYPFSTFKFYNKDAQTWGIEFQRTVARTGETMRWATVSKNNPFFYLSKQGELIGIKGIQRGNPIYLKPFATAGLENSETDKSTLHKVGLDVKYGLTQSLSLDLTFNTDFAQVESDVAVINLSRFPFFFPEQREFFLEGANIFSFDFGGVNNLFYSRRIGISNENEISIIAGAKIVGRTDNMELGLLDMQTAEEKDDPSTNYGIARVKFDIFEQSYAGVFLSNKLSSNDFNRTIGADVFLSTNKFLDDKNLSFGLRIAKTDEKHGGKNSWAGSVFVDYPNDLIDQFFSYGFIQQKFNPGIGFISRNAIQSASYNLEISPRVDFGSIKKLQFEPINTDFEFDKDNTLLSADISIQPIGFTTVMGDEFSFQINRKFDLVEEDFELFDNNFIRNGRYWFTTFEATLNTTRTREFFGRVSAELGDFYNGTIKNYSGSLTWNPNSHLAVIGDIRKNIISLNNSEFTTNEYTARVVYDFSTKVNSSIFTQWNNELNELNMNYRVKWEPSVGSNFYFVVNHLLSTVDKLKSKDFTVLLKFVWLFIL